MDGRGRKQVTEETSEEGGAGLKGILSCWMMRIAGGPVDMQEG